MKTQITIETTNDQEMVIGVMKTGSLVKATQGEVREYFEAFAAGQKVMLDNKARGILEAAGVKASTESDVKGA